MCIECLIQCTINNHLWHNPFVVQEAILGLFIFVVLLAEIVDSLFCLVVYIVVSCLQYAYCTPYQSSA